MRAETGRRGCLKRLAVIMMALVLTLAAAMPAFAASRTKITSVKITVTEDDITPGTRFGSENIDIDVDSGHYYFDYYEIENDGYEWKEDQTPRIIVHLRVDDPDKYYFSSSLRNNFSVSGAAYVSGTLTTADEATELYFKIDLMPMNERVGDIESVTLNDSGYVYWDAPIGAGSYELRVYRNGNLDGTTDIKTDATEYNLKDHMSRAGSYSVRVRACNGINPANKGEWAESPIVTISSERANEIREGLDFSRPKSGDWVHTDAGWIYQYEDGSMPEPGWFYTEGHWFWLGEDGTMATGWITVDGLEYYMDDITGRLLTNTTTPDGYKVDGNGNKRTD